MDVPDAIQLMGDKQWQEMKSRLTGKFNKMMKGLFRQKGAQLDINILASDEAQEFITTHAGILDGGFQKVEMSDKMRERLTRSNYIFSGIKTFHELNEAFPSMVDENGNKKPFERFLNDVQKINDTYNANYLHAEYNFVQASATMAAKWEQFSEDGDRYNLQYRTAKDDKVRPEHAALDGVTLPMSDSFWETYYPPNGWNCFLPNTPVLTANGWKHIASIKKGDLVIGGSGEFREVTATLSRPFEGDLVTIITKGAKSTCTPNHRFCTRRGWVAAENLHKGDIIIQVGERSPLHLLVHAVGNTYTLLCYALMACIRKGKAVASLAVNHKPEFFNKEIYDVASNKLANLEWKAHCKEVASHDFFAFTQWQTQCAHPLWMKLASGKGIFDRILSYRWSKQRRGALQFVRYITNEAAIFLGLTLAHVKSFSCKFMVCLSKTFGCILSSFFRSNPLNADSCASMPDRDAQFAKNAMHSSSVHLPISNEPSEASLFCDVSEFCGIKDIHSFDGFHSFFDFLRNTFFHNRYVLVEGKATKKNRNTKVFNLSIHKDESYIVPVGIAHNCRCTVVQVRKQKYPATEHAEAMSRGEEAMNGERYNIFRFNSGKKGKTMPDYNPYTIRRCNDCDVAKGKLKLSFVPENNLCASCIKTRECWARRQEDDPETFYECETRRGKVRVSSKHGKTEKKENVRVATYLAEKHEHEIDLIANPQNETSADSFNRTLGIEQEYKVNTTPTKSSIDNLIRKGAKQADDIVLFVDSGISLNDLSSALHDRVRRTNLKTVMIVIDEKDKTYTYDEITAKGFKIRQADLK
jgi:SPP1 gp7 family putative phage head morphogenesis protein